MLSTIVLFEEMPAKLGKEASIEGLVRTLASLVAPHVEGILGDVKLAGPKGYELERIADHAGCSLIEGVSSAQVFENLRYQQFLLLRAGYALKPAFIEEAGDLVRYNRGRAFPVVKLLGEPEDFVQRLFPGSAAIAGLIAPKSLGLEASCGSLSALMGKKLGSQTLRTRARRTI